MYNAVYFCLCAYIYSGGMDMFLTVIIILRWIVDDGSVFVKGK